MIRVVYCPIDGDIELAKKISEENKLPIMVGESENSSSADFDRNVVSVVSVPDAHFMFIASKTINKNLSQIIDYTNEFLNLKNCKLDVIIQNEIGLCQPKITFYSINRIRCVYKNIDYGTHRVSILVNDILMCTEDWDVI